MKSAPFGAPVRLRIPTKLGATNRYPGGYWENQGYNRFSGS